MGSTTSHRLEANLTLKRPRIQEYEKALVNIGLDEADAKRLAVNTGRSWGVFRRRRATNPAIQNPAWLAAPQAESLTTLCLLDTWSANKAEDRAIVAYISGRTYEDIEKNLLYLAGLDDAPLLKIGEGMESQVATGIIRSYGRTNYQRRNRPIF